MGAISRVALRRVRSRALTKSDHGYDSSKLIDLLRLRSAVPLLGASTHPELQKRVVMFVRTTHDDSVMHGGDTSAMARAPHQSVKV